MLSLVLPTYNEAANIRSLLEGIDAVLQFTPYEVIVVDDDSPDQTWRVAKGLAAQFPHLRVYRRVGKRGLSSAVTEGVDMARGDVLAVMDADGQHDAVLLLTMLRAIDQGSDLVIGSRYIEGGSVGDWVTDRRIISRAGTLLARNLSRVPVTDPLSGFFMLRANLYREARPLLKPTGFKILLEVLSHVPPTTRIAEVPLIFRMRLHGQSKLSFCIHVAFLCQILRLLSKRLVRIGPSLFGLITLLLALALLPRAWSLRFLYTDAQLRANVKTALETVAQREGWLLSDISLVSVTPQTLSIIHQDHLRTAQPRERCTIILAQRTLACDALSQP